MRSPTSQGRGARPLEVAGLERHDRDDVGGADPRVGTVVQAQVDPLDRRRDPCEQRVGQLLLAPDEREDRAVVVDVGVDVEQPRVRPRAPSRSRRSSRGRALR